MDNKTTIFCQGARHHMERFMEICLLFLLSKEDSHGYTLAEKLPSFGFAKEELNIASLYRTLRKMEKDTYVTSKWLEGNQGPKKRLYQITETGENILEQWIQILKNRKKRIEKLINSYDSIKNKINKKGKLNDKISY